MGSEICSLTIQNPDKWLTIFHKPFEIRTKMSGFRMVWTIALAIAWLFEIHPSKTRLQMLLDFKWSDFRSPLFWIFMSSNHWKVNHYTLGLVSMIWMPKIPSYTTVGIRLTDVPGNRMVKTCSIAEWSVNWMPFSKHRKSPVTKWLWTKIDIYGPQPFGYRIFSPLTEWHSGNQIVVNRMPSVLHFLTCTQPGVFVFHGVNSLCCP